ncbi:MAG: hypothetical protein IEMM0008_1697 [bacterium]|nr:MAG: hypothetical protein IEMM0008_1697 [bacterium]
MEYSSSLLTAFETIFEDYYIYLKNTTQLDKSKDAFRDFIGESKEKVDKPEEIKDQKNATDLKSIKKQKVQNQMIKINRFLQFLLHTNDQPLILKGIQLKERFITKLKKDYKDFKSLGQSLNKETSD